MPLFHIHIDAAWLTPEFESQVTNDLGFRRTDFIGADGGRVEPFNHLTFKTDNSPSFQRSFAKVVAAAEVEGAMAGYIEGELIALDLDLPARSFDATVPPPFELITGTLPPATFRESEVHIAMCVERSDQRLMRSMLDMGFLSVYMPKPWGVSIIFTAQGTREIVRDIAKAIVSYLNTAGGAARCSIKEEVIAKWWMSDGGVAIPQVVQAINWNGSAGRARHGDAVERHAQSIRAGTL
jgi:hypothetical protein